MKIAILTDTHWGARAESPDLLAHMLLFYREQFFPYLDLHRIKTVFHLGDIVDRRKFIQFSIAHYMRQNFFVPCEERGLDLHILIGNHDSYFKNCHDIHAMQELYGALGDSNAWRPTIYSKPEIIEMGTCKMLMLPWINDGNAEVSFTALREWQADVVFGHLEIKGFEMYRGMPAHEGFDAELFSRFNQVYSGHFHRKSQRGNISYLGAPYEMTWSDFDDPRGFHVFDTETGKMKYVQNPRRLFHKLWYDDTLEKPPIDATIYKGCFLKVVVTAKNDPVKFDQYMANLYAAGPADVRVVDDHYNSQQLTDEELIDQAEDTMAILGKYVASLEGTVDKVALTKLFQALHTEALNMESQHD